MKKKKNSTAKGFGRSGSYVAGKKCVFIATVSSLKHPTTCIEAEEH